MKKSLLILAFLFTTIVGYSQTFIKNNITYTVTSTSNNTVGVSGYNINGGTNVTIPSSVTPNASGKSSSKTNSTTYIVTTIEVNAFSNKPLTSVSIPNTITEIKAGAFFNNNLRSVTIPTSVTTIGNVAFAQNDALNCVYSPNTTPPTITTFTNGHSFGENRSHTTLIIPASAVSAYANPNNGAQWTGFRNAGQPFEVNDTFVSNYLTYKITSTTNNTVIVTNYNMTGGGVVNIPSSVSDCTTTYNVVGISDFSLGNKAITSVTIPNTFTYIGKSAFNNCDLTSVTIPSSVLTIKESAFGNNHLNSVTLSEGITTIENYAFSSNQIASLHIPASITSIGDGAFAVNSLSDVYSYATTPATVTTVASNTDSFGSTRSTINLHIPTGTTDVYVTNSGALWTNFNSVTEDGALSTPNFKLSNNIKIGTTATAIKIISDDSIKLLNYTIYNISGVEVLKGNEKTISTSFLSKGIYILELNFNKGKLIKKFAK